MAGYIDTHTHIYLEEFDADRAEVVSRARAAGAEALFLPNIDATSVAPMLRLCEAYPGFCFRTPARSAPRTRRDGADVGC